MAEEDTPQGLAQEALLFKTLEEKFAWSFDRRPILNERFAIDAIARGNDHLPFVTDALALQVKFFSPFPEDKYHDFIRRTQAFSARCKVFICCHPEMDIDPQGAAVVDMALKAILFDERHQIARACALRIASNFICSIDVTEELTIEQRDAAESGALGKLNKNDRDCMGVLKPGSFLREKLTGFITAENESFYFDAGDLPAGTQEEREAIYAELREWDEVMFDVQNHPRYNDAKKKTDAGRARRVRPLRRQSRTE